MRPSRAPLVFARLVRIRKSQVFRLERSSKRSIPLSTASQVSCTTSSAVARSRTYICATRSMVAPYIDQLREGGLVALAQSLDQFTVLSHPAARTVTCLSLRRLGMA